MFVHVIDHRHHLHLFDLQYRCKKGFNDGGEAIWIGRFTDLVETWCASELEHSFLLYMDDQLPLWQVKFTNRDDAVLFRMKWL